MNLGLLLQLATALLLLCVWITEIALVRELRNARESQGAIRNAMSKVQSALDALADKIAIIAGKFKI